MQAVAVCPEYGRTQLESWSSCSDTMENTVKNMTSMWGEALSRCGYPAGPRPGRRQHKFWKGLGRSSLSAGFLRRSHTETIPTILYSKEMEEPKLYFVAAAKPPKRTAMESCMLTVWSKIAKKQTQHWLGNVNDGIGGGSCGGIGDRGCVFVKRM